MEERTISKRKQIIRNTAILLVVAIIVTTLASYLATGASIVAQEQIYDANSAAESYLANNTEYVQQNRVERAKALLGQALSGFSKDYNSHYDALSIAIANEKYEKALEEANACLAMIDENHQSYQDIMTKKGCLEALLGKYSDARESFDVVLKKNPDMAQAHLLMAELCLESSDIVQATEHLVRYTELTPGDNSQLPVIAELYYGQNNFAKAIEYGEKAIKAGCSEDMDLRNAIALSRLLSGDYEKALIDLDRAIEIGENDEAQNKNMIYAIAPLNETYYYRGLCKMTLAKYEEGIADYDEAINRGYDTSLVYYNRGVCELQVEDYQSCYDDMKVVQQKNDEKELTEIAKTITDAIDQAVADAQSEAEAAAAAAAAAESAAGTLETDVPAGTQVPETQAPETQAPAQPDVQVPVLGGGGPANAPFTE